MKKVLRTLPLVAAALAMAACGGNNKNYEKLVAQEWVLESVDHADSANAIVVPQNLTIQFSDSARMYGRGPCNGFFGPYTVKENDRIEFGNIASTMAYCLEMPFESNYFNWLDEIDIYNATDNTLTLKSDGDKVVLHYKAKVK